jgi:hypothetical protein
MLPFGMILKITMQGVVVFACNPSTQETKSGRSRVPGQPRLHNKNLSQENKNHNQELCFGDPGVE